MSHYDLLVIGTGPAGQKAAIQAAKLNKKVGIIERKMVLGGVCINTGTIPSKSLREAVLYLSGFRQRSLYGAQYRLKKSVTIEDLAFRANHVIKNEIQDRPKSDGSQPRRHVFRRGLFSRSSSSAHSSGITASWN